MLLFWGSDVPALLNLLFISSDLQFGLFCLHFDVGFFFFGKLFVKAEPTNRTWTRHECMTQNFYY